MLPKRLTWAVPAVHTVQLRSANDARVENPKNEITLVRFQLFGTAGALGLLDRSVLTRRRQ